MSLIINTLIKKIGLVPTTKDLIYKNKILEPHNLHESYMELWKKNFFLKTELNYGDKSLFFNNNNDEMTKFKKLFSLHSKLSNFCYEKNKKSVHPNNIVHSEIFNSLWIEGVRSSKRKIKQFLKNPDIDVNKEISKYSNNYNDALNFIFHTNTIDEKTFHALYVILSRDINLGSEELDGYPYRLEQVEIGSPDKLGIDQRKIKQSMDSIFNIIKEESNERTKPILIVLNAIWFHYLFELIHPYYDMNGRMGRLLTIWYSNITGFQKYFFNFSEAINLFKDELYYGAFKKSEHKDFKYDVTYFTQNILFAMVGQRIDFLLIEKLDDQIKTKYKVRLSDLQRDILLSLISKDDKWYLIEHFILGWKEINQGQLSNALSQLVHFNILEETNTKPKEYKFNWNKENIEYINNLIEINIKIK